MAIKYILATHHSLTMYVVFIEIMVRIGLVRMLRCMQMKMRMELEKQYNIILTTKVSL